MKLARWFLCGLVATAISSAGAASAATYYVSTGGGDSRSCSQAQSAWTPKRSLSRAMDCLRAGDTLYVRGGTYDESINNPLINGTSWDNKIRIAAYPGETVWVSPSSSAGDWYVLYLSRSQRYLEFDGLNLDGSAKSHGIVKIEGAAEGNPHHIRIQNAELVGNPYGVEKSQGVMVRAMMDSIIGGNEFINLTLHPT